MPQRLVIRLGLILFVVGLFTYFLIPTFQFYSLSPEEKKQLEINDPDRYSELVKKSIKLGLDLQGGMHLVLEVDVKALLDRLAKNKDERFSAALEAAALEADTTGEDLVDVFDRKLREQGADILLYYGTRDLRTHEDVLSYLKEQADESITRTLEIVRNRVDQFGVSEPAIQKQGNRRIIIELAGIDDPERAKRLIGETARLEFRLLKEDEVAFRVTEKINDYLLGKLTEEADTSAVSDTTEEAPRDTSVVRPEELFGTGETGEDTALAGGDTTEAAKTSVAKEPLFVFPRGVMAIKANSVARFKAVMEDPEVQRIIEQEAGEAEFLLARKPDPRLTSPEEDAQFYRVYLVNKHAELGGETIVDARQQRGSLDDPSSAGKWEVSLTFNSEGARAFSRVTGANIGKPMAIVLDRRVQSAPVIQAKIRDGRARITGLETAEEARDLAIALRAGALPAPAKIIAERSVGASLGKDSVEQGFKSAIWGLALVALFMMAYYRFSGFVANIALVLNILILMGLMAYFHATLTLPGIAGIILTIGMAVDANVLIFERIREELDKGKSTTVAIDIGYGRAFVTIFDANLTTLIAAIVLYNFGSGPIRGFATTLMIGILASMFTAIYVTRTIFEVLIQRRVLKRMSI
ncbi:MAG: protein translocase subunit SecD [Calditrichaeota bacterium]|nr:MAG: protein translocase subunit SecD [Calditrichota bacterium]